MPLFDVHAHLTHPELLPRLDDILRRARDAGVTTIVSNGLNPTDNQQVLELSRREPMVRPAIGLYPVDAVLRSMRVDPVAGRLVPDRLRGPAWAVGMVAAALATSVGIALRPGLAAGAVLGAAILVFTLLRPLAVIGVMLAIGALDLSFVTGGFKSLYLSLGGLDMNGIRLIGMVASLGAIMAVDPEVVRHAIGRHGRLYLIFLLYGAATLLYTSSLIDGLRLLFKLAYPFLVFVAVLGVVRTREELGRLVDWILIGAVTLSLINPLYVIAGEYEIDPSGFLRMRGLGGHHLHLGPGPEQPAGQGPEAERGRSGLGGEDPAGEEHPRPAVPAAAHSVIVVPVRAASRTASTTRRVWTPSSMVTAWEGRPQRRSRKFSCSTRRGSRLVRA